ncbi:MAG: alanine racemase [Bauldia sp.]
MATGGRLTIDLGALAANWRALADRVGDAVAAAAVVKGDGYGIGLEQAAVALAEVGCHTFFVALPDEGLRLRRAVRDATIYVLDGLLPGSAEALVKADLRPVLGSLPEIEEWAAVRSAGAPTGSALHVDTGMNRLGVTPAEARALSEHGDLLDAIRPSLLMSHLAAADTADHPLNRKQLTAFRAVRVLLPNIPASLANSAGIFLGREYHFDLVRPGIALYGGAVARGEPSPLDTVVTLEAQVLQVREVKSGDTVGYGATETCARPSRVAILAAGYADGYHRAAGSTDGRPGARVGVGDNYAPLIGRVSMDLIAVDVTEIHGVERGDWAELIGPNIPVDEVAERAGTIGYELLTGLGRRYERVYVGGLIG